MNKFFEECPTFESFNKAAKESYDESTVCGNNWSNTTVRMIYELKSELDQLRKEFEEYKTFKRNKALYEENWY